MVPSKIHENREGFLPQTFCGLQYLLTSPFKLYTRTLRLIFISVLVCMKSFDDHVTMRKKEPPINDMKLLSQN